MDNHDLTLITRCTDEDAALLMCAMLTGAGAGNRQESFDTPGGISSVRHLDDAVRRAYRNLTGPLCKTTTDTIKSSNR
jgi:hypothetical protein